MPLDAVIISSYKDTTLSHTSEKRLHVDGQLATIQLIKELISNKGGRPSSRSSSDRLNFHHAIKLSGITIFSCLIDHFNCEVIDFLEYEENRFNDLLEQSPQFVIISTSFIYDKRTLLDLTTNIKARCGSAIIIAGGPFVLSSYLLYERRNSKDYDTDSARDDFLFLSDHHEPLIDYYIVAHQGLDILLSLMKSIKSEESIKHIPNIISNDNGQLRFNEIDLAAKYEYNTINWRKLPEHLLENRVASLQASNGCPFACRFCNFVKDRKATFVREIDKIVGDMLDLQSLGIKYLRFADDNFLLGGPGLNRFCHSIIESGVEIKWHSFMRLSNLKGTDLSLLKRAGCHEVLFGLESANPMILKNMNKQIDSSMYRKLIQDLLSVGINVGSTFIIGFPGETVETAQDTFDFIDSINTDGCHGIYKWSIFPFTLLPGSPIYTPEERKKYNLRGYMKNWHHDTMDSDTALKLIDNAYKTLRGIGPGYTSDNLDEWYHLTPAKRRQFSLIRYNLSKERDGDLSYEDCKTAFSGIFKA